MSSPTVAVSLILQDLATAISVALNDTTGENVPFALVLQVDGVTQYISNAKREDGTEMIKSLLERWEAGKADIPAHYNPDLKTAGNAIVQNAEERRKR